MPAPAKVLTAKLNALYRPEQRRFIYCTAFGDCPEVDVQQDWAQLPRFHPQLLHMAASDTEPMAYHSSRLASVLLPRARLARPKRWRTLMHSTLLLRRVYCKSSLHLARLLAALSAALPRCWRRHCLSLVAGWRDAENRPGCTCRRHIVGHARFSGGNAA